MGVETVFTRHAVRRLAGEVFFERGQDYVESGRVRSLEVGDDEVRATVRGTRSYDVRLWVEEDAPAYSCTCPVGAERQFCKHCVAVALAVSARSESPEIAAEPEVDLRSHLLAQDKETLVDLLVGQARADDFLRGRLLLDAAKKGGAPVDLDDFRVAITTAIEIEEFVDYRSMPAYADDVMRVVDSIENLLKEGHADQVIELCELALAGLEEALDVVDDSDGYMGMLMERVCDLHYDACATARPDPEELALSLFDWELNSGWGTFRGAALRYADVLGEAGLSAYHRLAEVVWAKVPPLTAHDEDLSVPKFRYNITCIIEALASLSGDVDELVVVKRRDLSIAYRYIEIAELYRDAGRHDDALEWAEKGVAAFPDRTDRRVRVFLADEYQRRDRHDDALALVWKEVTDSPTLRSVQLLHGYATRAGAWEQWRQKALDHLRERVEQRKAAADPRLRRRPDHSPLVEFFLWEEDVDAAWAEAQAGGCSDELWLELAAKRAADYPEDALPIYQRAVEMKIDRKDKKAYAEAVALMRTVKQLMEQTGRAEDFAAYVASVRTAHHRKRNLMELLDRAGWRARARPARHDSLS